MMKFNTGHVQLPDLQIDQLKQHKMAQNLF